jgi:hypothetical protein
MKYTFCNYDADHKSAVNSINTPYYNCPISVTIDGNKYLLGIGTKDAKTVIIKEHIFYLIAKNIGLNYISLTVINTQTQTVSEAFLNSSEINEISPDILDEEPEQQINILSDYLN